MGGIETLKIQLTLNAGIEADKKLIEYINKHGKRSGIPKHLIMLGFESLMNGDMGQTIATTTTPKEEVKEASAPNLNQYLS